MKSCIKKTIIPLLLLFITSVFAQEGQISIKSGVDRDVITIGDRINYHISVTYDKNIDVEYPGLGTNLGAFEIKDYKVFEPEKSDGKIINKVEYIVTTFDTGNFVIPPVSVSYFSSDSVVKELKTDIIKVRVNSVKPSEAEDIKDIKPPVEIEIDYRKYIYYCLAVLGLLGILSFIFYYYKRKKKGKDILPGRKKPIRPAHIEAIEELEKLKNSNLLSEGRIKKFYIVISEIIRIYIERRYFIYTLEMTTTQICDGLYNTDAGSENIELTREFLELCDFVKFAKYIPSEDENKRSIEQAYEIVDRTKTELVLQAV